MENDDKKYYTYVLLTESNTLYCGYTDDVEKRFEFHKSGKGAKYTRANKPVKISYTACFDTKSEAQKEESKIKRMTKLQKLEYIKAAKTKL